MAHFFVVGCVGLMVVVVGMGSLWWRWLWFLVEFGWFGSDSHSHEIYTGFENESLKYLDGSLKYLDMRKRI